MTLGPVVEADQPRARILGLLAQIRAALERLDASGESSNFDLRGLPMTPEEEALVEQLLGRGEVTATLHAGGDSEIWECAFAGVWFVVHRDGGGAVLGKFIEVCAFPELLRSQPPDIHDAVEQLNARIARTQKQLTASGGLGP